MKRQNTVLIVEDEESLREICARVLVREGYAVLVAGDGREGIEILRANSDAIDLVLLDWIMPNMGGFEVYNTIKGLKPDVSVILMTGHSDVSDFNWGRTNEAPAVLHKPYTPSILSETVRSTLEGKRA